ncbi:non-canonical purine NTP pyrophosphatase [Gracilibacillus sp. S3-1-1]|uniref:Non-canonical purine NTP pyrophosphatase n=1 Tax=Gracilibacillus pellucidus TaxID=3095368 RepID=A0ACC6M0D9_9BACI|nr:non-canonical purine NTP pyrophosphatase [Gracilibacillus sp. S3-1-1]MDX8044404.1 non-canonical purine NTP pyrophosphatase [Gracilibacillus sp. S3-1-1]
MKLIIASWNKTKIKEIQEFFKQIPIEIASLSADMDDINETAASFEGNAQLKIEAVKKYYPNDILLGEDSGLTIDALGGFPGVKTARFFPGSDTDRARQLIERLAGVPLSNRTAHFNSAIALRFPNGEVINCQGFMHGWITDMIHSNIQGYGDIFLLSNQITLSKQEQSILPFDHRRQALFQAKQHILEWIGGNQS